MERRASSKRPAVGRQGPLLGVKGAQPMEGGALACRSQAISDSGSEEFLADEVIATSASTRGSRLANVYMKRGLSEATGMHGPCGDLILRCAWEAHTHCGVYGRHTR
jgi:hypothetical protein